MKEFTNFTLGMAYILGWKAILELRDFRLPLTNDYIGIGIFFVCAMIFIGLSIVYLSCYYLSLIHDIFRKASE